MDLLKEIHEFVAEHQPVNDKIAYIGGKNRKFIGGEINFNEIVDEFFEVASKAPNWYIFVDATLKSNDQSNRFKDNQKTTLQDVVFLGKTEFNGISFAKDFTLFIEATDNASIIFKNCIFKSKIKIRCKDTGDYEHDQNNKIKLKELRFIDCRMLREEGSVPPDMRIGFLHVENFELSNLRVPNNAEVNIGDCDFGNFKLSNFRNLGKFKIYKINVEKNKRKRKGNFQIDNTSIGNADFQSIDLASFETRTIFDNILSDVHYTNVQWEGQNGDDIEVEQCPKGENMERERKRDTYRVLKNVAQNNNDAPQAAAFYAKEMKYHRAVLKNSEKKDWLERLILRFNCWTGGFGKDWVERVILWFNRWSNNFGQNWLLPIVWILIVGGIFYFLLLLSLNGEYDYKLWNKFFVFLNPTHKTDFIDEKCWNGCAYFLDFLFRIIEGSLIYQAIQAFRRHSRKF